MVRNYKRKTIDRWSKADLMDALLFIRDAQSSVKQASKQFGISKATLYRHYSTFIRSGGKLDFLQLKNYGGRPILSALEEVVLVRTIENIQEHGSVITASDVKKICFEYCVTNGIPTRFKQEKRMASDDWYYGFRKRHPDLKMPGLAKVANRVPSRKRRKAETSAGSDGQKTVKGSGTAESGATSLAPTHFSGTSTVCDKKTVNPPKKPLKGETAKPVIIPASSSWHKQIKRLKTKNQEELIATIRREPSEEGIKTAGGRRRRRGDEKLVVVKAGPGDSNDEEKETEAGLKVKTEGQDEEESKGAWGQAADGDQEEDMDTGYDEEAEEEEDGEELEEEVEVESENETDG